MTARLAALALFATAIIPAIHADDTTKPIDLDSRRELFVDRNLIDRMDGIELRLEQPRDEGIAFKFDHPWEGAFSAYCTIIRDGDEYRAYYRGNPTAGKDGSNTEVTCVAFSKDGIHWTRPELNLFEVHGAKINNVILAGMPPFSHNFCPMVDPRPDIPRDQRYKALAGSRKTGLHPFVSADGIHWRKLTDKGVITDGAGRTSRLVSTDLLARNGVIHVIDEVLLPE